MNEQTGLIIGYGRVSTDDQTCENQRMIIEAKYGKVRWHQDAAVSGTVPALQRPALATIMKFAGENDTLVVTAIDRLGRNTIDVLTTVEALKKQGVKVISLREHFDLSTPFGEFMLTMLAGLSKLERENIRERQLAGINRARAEGKNLGKAKTIVDSQVAQWRADNRASIAETAKHFSISPASVKRACKNAPAQVA